MAAPQTSSPRNLLTSLILVFPLFLVYQVGVLFTLPRLNGADFLTSFLIGELHLGVLEYLGFSVGVAAVFGVVVYALRRKQKFNGRIFLPVLLESAIYALTMGSAIILVMDKLLGISPRLAGGVESEGIVSRLVMSIGAGVWEETVFRLILLSGLAVFFEKVVGLGRFVAIGAAFLLSSVAFSAMHHIGVYGDPLRLGVFTFRTLAGICFGLLYWFRGFAVAVYTHALYDVYVLLIR